MEQLKARQALPIRHTLTGERSKQTYKGQQQGSQEQRNGFKDEDQVIDCIEPFICW